jgi:predicted thioesterase
MANPEQRRHPRIRRRFPVTIAVRGRTFSAVSEDLSPSGLLVRCPEILQPGTAVSGALELEGQVLSFGAVVRWSRSASRTNSNETQHSMGLAFLSNPGTSYIVYFERAVAEQVSPATFEPASTPPMARPLPAASPDRVPKIPPSAAPAVGGPVAVSSVAARALSSQAIAAAAPRAPERQVAPPSPQPEIGTAKGLVPGLIGRVETNTKVSDPKGRGALPFAPAAAAVLFERAAVQAIAAVLPPETQTLGISLKINMNRPPHVIVGAKLEAIATLLSVATDWTLRFQIELREGERLVASGEHQRILVAGQVP